MKFLKRSPYTTDPRSAFARLSLLCMIASACVRVIYYGRVEAAQSELLVHLGLPLLSAVIFFVTVQFFSRKYLAATAVSVLLGVVFFVFRIFALKVTPIHTVLCICLYTLVLTLFTLTIFGAIPTKKLLYPLFGLPLLYHIFVEDMEKYVLADPPVPFVQWLPEISVLLIMAGLLCLSIAMKKRETTAM